MGKRLYQSIAIASRMWRWAPIFFYTARPSCLLQKSVSGQSVTLWCCKLDKSAIFFSQLALQNSSIFTLWFCKHCTVKPNLLTIHAAPMRLVLQPVQSHKMRLYGVRSVVASLSYGLQQVQNQKARLCICSVNLKKWQIFQKEIL